MRSHWIGVGPNPMIALFIRRGTFRQNQGECHVKAEAVMYPQVKKCQGVLANARS